MKGHFRQSMSWLHTWCGLSCGWLLCAVMLTGTLSVFREPITRWMEAKPALPSQAATVAPAVLDQAALYLAKTAPGARFWRIDLPREAGDALQLVWRAGKASQQVAVHPATGEVLPQPWGRQTEGGRHFMSFHYMLHAGTPGYWLVGWVSMCMLVALVSGVVVHRRIFQDFFTFRPGKGQRSWLDAHNATGVLELPFLFMIAYTGLSIFYTSYMPWPLQAAYGQDGQADGRFQAELAHEAPPPRRKPTGAPATLHALAPLLREAEALTGRPAHMVVVEQPGDAAMLVRVRGAPAGGGPSGTILNPSGSVVFDGVSGAVLQLNAAEPPARFSSEQVHGVMESLHFARFGGWSIRGLYFLSGLMGTALVATGVILFTVKRRKKSALEFGSATAGVYRVIEALNVTAVAGICVASIAYLHANRLLPAEWPGRPAHEVQAFLGVWLGTLLHALARPPARAWVEQLSVAALLCLCLPLVNAWTTGQHLVGYLADGDGQRAGVELTALVLGITLAWTAWRVRSVWRKSAIQPKPKARPRTAASPEAKA